MDTYEEGIQLNGESVGRECDQSCMPSWDQLLADIAEIIREDQMYPEEMPWECFDVTPMGCYNFY